MILSSSTSASKVAFAAAKASTFDFDSAKLSLSLVSCLIWRFISPFSVVEAAWSRLSASRNFSFSATVSFSFSTSPASDASSLLYCTTVFWVSFAATWASKSLLSCSIWISNSKILSSAISFSSSRVSLSKVSDSTAPWSSSTSKASFSSCRSCLRVAAFAFASASISMRSSRLLDFRTSASSSLRFTSSSDTWSWWVSTDASASCNFASSWASSSSFCSSFSSATLAAIASSSRRSLVSSGSVPALGVSSLSL
mmetsp:Transcript_22115/g.39224  ORF Transcript_22115/g.39224 Transcript_22115/m.39224 type:complete len:254 (-) Transcript_22115:378-1139(-)